jgi:hypothetical protein
LFRAITPLNYLDMPTDRELGWGPLAEDGVEVREIPGTHREIMREPNVEVLAREVSASLAAVVERQRDSRPVPSAPKPKAGSSNGTVEIESLGRRPVQPPQIGSSGR